eukprot:COSAG01_NODE_6993_length_3399_cov_11.666162_6_plen_36_part_01
MILQVDYDEGQGDMMKPVNYHRLFYWPSQFPCATSY